MAMNDIACTEEWKWKKEKQIATVANYKVITIKRMEIIKYVTFSDNLSEKFRIF